MAEELTNLFDNLQIERNSKYENTNVYCEQINTISNTYDHLLLNLIKILIADNTMKINIYDRVIIINNVLFCINLNQNNQIEDYIPYKPLMRLPAYNNKLSFVSKNDPTWWDECCTEFENSMLHLKNLTNNTTTFNIKSMIDQKNYIEIEIINLTIKIMNKEKISEFSLVQMYILSLYLENFFIEYKLESIYSEEFLYTNKYFTFYSQLVINYLKKSDLFYSYNENFYLRFINPSLLYLLYSVKNTLILFRPYGYDALCDNSDIIDLNIHEIISFKKEGLKYFALNNLIELKLNNKKLHIINSDEYANVICNDAYILN
ncbi:uncharacterized protein OCT59_025776 [Rhizophagus irregularis]|uniref:uncharacterized protein n=1 Tax=Rhizophagus irregularis TaxID=588596 RepID=UPI0019DA18E2|nr:hypothetical protein OCT59_025776 [Rhizophagus irregularis]GET51380.1 hypothetical protein GLOIN_2v1786609 [Rhizophagus irregularis DAOM 181602=DAOM 197198]